MDRFAYLVSLRKLIAEEISGIKNASFSLYWDDTRANWLTQSRLSRLFQTATEGAASFGVHTVFRHSECGSRKHKPFYVMSSIGQRQIEYEDPRFIWGEPIDQGEYNCPCPCTSNPKPKKHYVLHDLIFEKEADQEFCKALGDILTDLYDAIGKAGDRKPRSGIREYLLRAILAINDLILPERIDAYIDRHTIELNRLLPSARVE